MSHIKVSFFTSDNDIHNLLIANLSEIGYTGFEETTEALIGYAPISDYSELDTKEIAAYYKLSTNIERIEDQNWNAEWEKSFEPVKVGDFCLIRANFHEADNTVEHEIIITPKMSFGTGHHATTQLMVSMMKDLDFSQKSIFDYGTGTGILAILAERLGAKGVLAIDNDQWSYENALENIAANETSHIEVNLATIEELNTSKTFDIILANINRNILVRYMTEMYQHLERGGSILMSGLLNEDELLIRSEAEKSGFAYVKTEMLNNWIAILFSKP